MALKAPPYPLIISATQGSADAFVQGSVLTGLTARQAYNLKSIELYLPAIAAVNNAQYQIALSRRSKAAMPNISDPDVIWAYERQVSLTTSGIAVYDRLIRYNFPVDVPLVEDTIYLCCDSASSSASNAFIARLEVELDTISDIDRLNIVTRSLS